MFMFFTSRGVASTFTVVNGHGHGRGHTMDADTDADTDTDTDGITRPVHAPRYTSSTPSLNPQWILDR